MPEQRVPLVINKPQRNAGQSKITIILTSRHQRHIDTYIEQLREHLGNSRYIHILANEHHEIIVAFPFQLRASCLPCFSSQYGPAHEAAIYAKVAQFAQDINLAYVMQQRGARYISAISSGISRERRQSENYGALP